MSKFTVICFVATSGLLMLFAKPLGGLIGDGTAAVLCIAAGVAVGIWRATVDTKENK